MQMQENVEAPPKSHIILYKTLSVLEVQWSSSNSIFLFIFFINKVMPKIACL